MVAFIALVIMFLNELFLVIKLINFFNALSKIKLLTDWLEVFISILLRVSKIKLESKILSISFF
ncbi:hypothetical protein NWP96_02460 [Mycoplasmopsis cynos]|nr:hypothetical protein [Mycoplasmopsis cynos]